MLYDEVTDLATRNLLRQHINRAILEARADGSGFAVLVVHIGGLELIRQGLGLAAGDRFLREVAARLARCAQDAVVARLEGELAILVPGRGNRKEAEQLAHEIHRQSAAPCKLQGQWIAPTVRSGIALGSGRYRDADEVLRDAALALRRARHSDHGVCAVFDVTMYEEAMAQIRLETALHRTLRETELTLQYQPIVLLETGRIAELQVQVDWRHRPHGCEIPLPMAESPHFGISLDERILSQACHQLQKWRARYPRDQVPAIAVRLPGRLLSSHYAVGYIHDLLAETRLSGRDLRLEVTERTLAGPSNASGEVLAQLRSASVKVYLGDCGSGFSSLACLQDFPLDTLKIPHAFVSQLATRPRGAKIVKSMVSLGHQLGMNTIAEGISSSSDVLRLFEMRCRYGQGDHFSPPVDRAQVEDILDARLSYIRPARPDLFELRSLPRLEATL